VIATGTGKVWADATSLMRVTTIKETKQRFDQGKLFKSGGFLGFLTNEQQDMQNSGSILNPNHIGESTRDYLIAIAEGWEKVVTGPPSTFNPPLVVFKL